MKKNIIHRWLLVVCLSVLPILFIGCEKNPIAPLTETKVSIKASSVVHAKIGDYVFDDQGRKYKKVTNESFDATTGIGKTDIWERVEPMDVTRWYTPSLGSKTFLDRPATFNSLYRLPGEDTPTF